MIARYQIILILPTGIKKNIDYLHYHNFFYRPYFKYKKKLLNQWNEASNRKPICKVLGKGKPETANQSPKSRNFLFFTYVYVLITDIRDLIFTWVKIKLLHPATINNFFFTLNEDHIYVKLETLCSKTAFSVYRQNVRIFLTSFKGYTTFKKLNQIFPRTIW